MLGTREALERENGPFLGSMTSGTFSMFFLALFPQSGSILELNDVARFPLLQ